MDAALDDVTIVDFSQMMQGPFATQKLGDMGADVIKVEPSWGDPLRSSRPLGVDIDGQGPQYLSMNRNKRCVCLDLKSDRGLEIALDLVADADVVVENFRPGVMEGLGLGYEAVKARNEDVIYASGSGWGSTGPYAERPGQDLLAQSISGLASNTGRRDDPPMPAGTSVADSLSALNIAFHVVIALYHRELTGRGQRIEANLMNSLVEVLCQEVTVALNSDAEMERSSEGVGYPINGAPFGVYETADGHLGIGGLTSSIDSMAEVLGVNSLPDYDTQGKRFENRDEIKRIFEERTREWETDELLEALLEADCWVAEVKDVEGMAADPQVQHNDMIVDVDHPDDGTFKSTGIPVDMSETPGEIESHPPKLGEHNEPVLKELGYSDEEIERLREDDVISEE